jgi:hypothetical protein
MEEINAFTLKILINVVHVMQYLMKVSNVQDVHFYVVQSALVIFVLLIKIIALFVDIKKIQCMIYMLKYHPYKSDEPGKKYYIITNDNKKVYFGAAGMSDFTIHKDEQRRERYINRHKNSNEIWSKSGIDAAGWWSLKYLWSYPTKEEAYNHIKKDLKNGV